MFDVKVIVAAVPFLLATPAMADDLLTGRLEASDPRIEDTQQHYDDWTFEAVADQRLLLTVKSADFVPRLLLFAPGAPDDAALVHETLGGKHGDGYGITVSMPLAATGTWTLRVTQDSAVDGDYTVDISVR